ncbi:KxYKxGKxW signal peptide domain-containing protein [Leuconostoc pseudomesenteroides]|uniref:KxYKxGKxW signal peptide domain-containing protein n=1 Tax=Leuconostoc pseudomesenteroides TaxID=33968 RepID=UPI0032DF66F6
MENTKKYKLYKDGKKWVVGAIAVAGFSFATTNLQQVSADTTTNSDPQAVQKTDTAQDDKQVQLQPASSNEQQDTKAAQSEQVKSDVPTTVAPNTTPDEAKSTIDKAQDTVKGNVDTAKQSGVEVTEGATQDVTLNKDNVGSKSNEILNDLNKQDEAIKQATATQQENDKAYQDATQNRNDVIKQGQADIDKANASQDKAIDEAKQSGVKVTQDTTALSPEYKPTQGLTGQDLLAVQKYNADLAKKTYEQAVASTNASTAEIEKTRLEDIRRQGIWQATSDRIKKANADRKAIFDKLTQEYMTGTNLEKNLVAKTQTDQDTGTLQTFMNADVNQETGEFTLSHDMNNNGTIIGRGYLKGKILYEVKSNGDGSETVKVTGIELYSYTYNKITDNTNPNKNINFHVYDFNGNEIYAKYHDGGGSFDDAINKTFALDKTFILLPNQSSDLFEFLKIDDNWDVNTHGQVSVQFKNTNKQPTPPDYEVVPSQPDMLSVLAHKYTVVEMPAPETPEQQKVSVHFYNVSVEPEPAQPKEETPVQPTPTKVVAQASVLPETGSEANNGSIILGITSTLASLSLLGAMRNKFKKQK